MRWRCGQRGPVTPNAAKYYADAGVLVCPEWDTSFAAFREWAIRNGYRDDLTIDRIDYRGGYEPANCRWVTTQEQNRHLSFGKLTAADVAGIKAGTLSVPVSMGIGYQIGGK